MTKVFSCIQYNAMSTEHIFANALNQSLQIGPASLNKIKKYFGSFENGWKAPISTLLKITELKKLDEFRGEIDPEKEMEILEKEGVQVLLKEDLPKNLQEIFTPPEVLYIKGSLPASPAGGPKETLPHLAVVGPRKFSSYGKEACDKIVSELKDYSAVIVSGLALGIDTIAHKTALENNMQTIAVLGSGFNDNVLFPQQNKKLANKIIENGGCLISEYPLDMRAAPYTFPQRNRIAAGLCEGTLVVEAPQKSGALITANLALENNREVFAIPGGIFQANSKGTNNLIKQGATPITNAEDILNSLGVELKIKSDSIDLSQEEKEIISLIYEPLARDELIRNSKMPPQEINPLLIQMEIKGIIKEIDGKIYPA